MLLNADSSRTAVDRDLRRPLLDPSTADQLADFWGSRLDIQISPELIPYSARKVLALESRLQGRLAAQGESQVLRNICALSTANEGLRLIEIGALFGVGLAAVHEFRRPFVAIQTLVAIDPLTSCYDTARFPHWAAREQRRILGQYGVGGYR